MKKLLGFGLLLFATVSFAQTPPPVAAPIPTPPSTITPPTLPQALPTTAVVSTAAPVDIEFLVDVSGSMSALVGTESQMDIAKKSIKQTLTTIPPNVPVALRVYAHRVPKANKEASCQDTELLIPFQPLNIAAFSAAVDSLKPNGYTPIAYSLKAAAQDFVGKESQHVVILLSDGEETCGGDPVAEAKNLLAQGFKVTIHTIGFRVDAKTKAQLAAISSTTGGSYYDASDAASLTQNLGQATQKALLINKPAEQARGQEIRGGNAYQDAVPLKSGIEYRLDHHQKKDQYDYFYVDVKRGQTVKVTMSTMDRGLEITSSNQAKETDYPHSGFRFLDSAFQQLFTGWLGGRHAKEEKMFIASKDERVYLLIGMEGYPIHKDTPFQIEVKSNNDANSGQDAGDEITNPTEIAVGDYPENWLVHRDDKDFYKLNAKAGEAYTIAGTPQKLKGELIIKVYDQDRVELFSGRSANAGAVVRIENVILKSDGPLYIAVDGWGFEWPAQYAMSIKTSAPPAGGGPLVAATAQPTAQDVGTQQAIQQMMQLGQAMAPQKAKSNTMLYGVLALAALVILGLLILVVVLLMKKKS